MEKKVNLFPNRMQTFCCEYKKSLLQDNKMFDTIDIIPKLISFQSRCVKTLKTLKREIQIKNKFHFRREFKVKAEFPKYLTYNIKGSLDLFPDLEFSIEVFLNLLILKKLKTLERHTIFISSEHPKVTIEVPVFIFICLSPDVSLSLPNKVFMADSSPKIMCFHSIQIYNPCLNSLTFTLKQIKTEMERNFEFFPNVITVPSRTSLPIFMKAISENYCPVKPILAVRTKNIKIMIPIEMQIKTYIPFLHRKVINFSNILVGTRSEILLRLCNDSYNDIKFKWCLHETLPEVKNGITVRVQKKINEEFSTKKETKLNKIKKLDKFFSLAPKSGSIKANTSIDFKAYFGPFINLSGVDKDPNLPQFQVSVYLAISCSFKRLHVRLQGTVKGPNIQISQKDINFHCVHVGEISSRELIVKNLSEVVGVISFLHFKSMLSSNICVIPKKHILEPKEPKTFKISYYSTKIGNFLDKLTFQIISGEKRFVTLRGSSCAVAVKLWDDSIEFGNVPICILQKKCLMIANPLTVPVSIELFIDKDGMEKPLMLQLRNTATEELNNTSFNVIDKIQKCESFSTITSFWIYESNLHMLESQKVLKAHSIVHAEESVCSDEQPWSVYSTSLISSCNDFKNFDNGFRGNLTNIAEKILDQCKDKKSHKTYGDAKILNKIIGAFKPYYEGKCIQNWRTFESTSWDLSTNPKEFVIETFKSYLRPHESKAIEINLIPNLPGSFKRQLKILCVPIQTNEYSIFLRNIHGGEHKINPNSLITKIDCYHACKIPDIEIQNPIIIFDTVYVESKQRFKLIITNTTANAGFVYFTLVPNIKDGRLIIYPTKFFIAGNETKHIPVTAFFNKAKSRIVLPGLIRVLGSVRLISYKVIAKVIPPKIKIVPPHIKIVSKVMTKRIFKLIIENICETKAKFSLHMKNTLKYVDVEPLGGILDPKQAIMIIIRGEFLDTGIYKNCLCINLIHFGQINVPLSFIIEEFPIHFTPDICMGLNLEKIFNTESICEIPITVLNEGEKNYTLNFHIHIKGKTNKNNPLTFEIVPNAFGISPNSVKQIILLVKTKKLGIISEILTVDAIYNNSERVKWFSTQLKVEIIKPICKWSKNCLTMFSKIKMTPTKRIFSENVKLTNFTCLPTIVKMEVTGEFVLYQQNSTELKYKEILLGPKEYKDMKIVFKEKNICGPRRRSVEYYGIVSLTANDSKQKSLKLRAILEFPTLKIFSNRLLFFAKSVSFFSKFYLENAGRLETNFKLSLESVVLKTKNYDDVLKMMDRNNISQNILSKLLLYLFLVPTDVDNEHVKSICNNIKNYEKDEQLLEIDVEEDSSYQEKVKKKNIKDKGQGDVTEKSKYENFKLTELHSTLSIRQSFLEVYFSKKRIKYSTNDIIRELRQTFVPIEEIIFEAITDLKLIFDESMHFKQNKNYEVESENSKGIIFDCNKSLLISRNKLVVNLFYEHSINGVELETKYKLDIIGNDSQYLKFCTYDIKAKLEISETKIDFGIQPWYKRKLLLLELSNPNNFDIFVKILFKEAAFKYGYLKIKQSNFSMTAYKSKAVEIDCLLGFSGNFRSDIAIEVNDNIPTLINFIGSGRIPMLSILDTKRPKLQEVNQTLAYKTLNNMFKDEIINIQVKFDEPKQTEIINFQKYLKDFEYSRTDSKEIKIGIKKKFSEHTPNGEAQTFEEKEISTNGECDYCFFVCPYDGHIYKTNIQKPRYTAELISSFDCDLRDFVIFDYPKSYPSQLNIEHEIEKNIFINMISLTSKVEEEKKKILKMSLSEENQIQILPSKILVPKVLNHYLSEYEYDFGNIYLGTNNEAYFSLVYHGPGSIKLSVRSEHRLIGFNVYFNTDIMSSKDINKKYKTYVRNSPHILAPEAWYKYRNRSERKVNLLPNKCRKCYNCKDFCGNCGIKFCHAHSFDFDSHLVHRRGLKNLKKNRKQIKDFYRELSCSSFRIHKDPWVLSDFFSNIDILGKDEIFMDLKFIFNPHENYYVIDTNLEEYIFLDIHMGPIIPILMRGTFKKFMPDARSFTKIISKELSEKTKKLN